MSDVDEIEVGIADARESVKLRDMVLKLTNNREFKKIITEGYFKEEAVRLVMAKANFALDEKTQEDISKRINSIGYLTQYLNATIRHGNSMEVELASYEEELAQAEKEG